jgi:hypothetical protein
LCDVLAARYSEGFYDRPVTVVLGSVGAVGLVAEAMAARSLPAVSVTATTRGRGRLFSDTVARRAVLLQVRAVGEGVDLPLRVMYDLSPTMSPVLWMQRVGRIMRPTGRLRCPSCNGTGRRETWDEDPDGNRYKEEHWCDACNGGGFTAAEPPPVYFSCCHNLMRHGYLFEGLIPRAAFTESRTAWGDDWEPSRRSMTRALGNTGFGRFHPVEVRLKGGGAAFLYALRAADGLRSYAALLLPHLAKPLYFGREDALTGRELEWTTPSGHAVKYPEKKVGRWTPLAELPDLEGCLSYPNDAMFPWKKQKWEREADARGLDAAAEVTRKTYTLLEILRDTNKRIPC